MPSAGGARFVVEGREVAAEVRESVRVVRRAGRVVSAAIVEILGGWLSRFFVSGGGAMIDCENGSFSRLGTRPRDGGLKRHPRRDSLGAKKLLAAILEILVFPCGFFFPTLHSSIKATPSLVVFIAAVTHLEVGSSWKPLRDSCFTSFPKSVHKGRPKQPFR